MFIIFSNLFLVHFVFDFLEENKKKYRFWEQTVFENKYPPRFQYFHCDLGYLKHGTLIRTNYSFSFNVSSIALEHEAINTNASVNSFMIRVTFVYKK